MDYTNIFKDKRNNAVVIGATGNIDFAVYCLVCDIIKYENNKVDNIIIFYDNFEDQSLEIIKSISKKCIFIKYEEKYVFKKLRLNNNLQDTRVDFFDYYKHMVFCKYELFNLTKYYKKLLWLDCDIIIKEGFADVFNYNCNIAVRKSTFKTGL